jgi:hypothetical protein
MDLAITPATGPGATRKGAGPGVLAESPIYLMAVNKSGIKPTGSGSETMNERRLGRISKYFSIIRHILPKSSTF